MKTQLLLNVKLVSLTILFVVYNNPIEAQINCESFKQIKTGNEIATSYSNWVGGKADLWGNSFLDIFVTGPNEIILASLQPESLYIEKYDALLNLIKSKSFLIVMNKARSYYGMTQVGEQLYIIYTEKISTGSLAKTTRLYAQRIDNNTLELTEEKIDMLGADDDIEIERNVPGALFAPKSKVYLGFSENHKYISILLYPQTKDDFAAASFIYKVFNPDLSIAYEGNISTPYKLIDLRSLETGISNDGEFALGIGVEKNIKKGIGDYVSQIIYFTNKSNKVQIAEFEEESGFAESLNFFFLDRKLYVDLIWQNFEDKSYLDYNKIFIFDFETGNKLKSFSNMLFNFLPEDEASTYGTVSKYGYDVASREFKLYAIQKDKLGNIYLSYIDFLTPPFELGAVAYVKLDENYENMWAHLFYFTDWETNELLLENNKIHAFGNSYEKISGASGSDINSGYKSQVDAINNRDIYRYEITFNEKGNFEIKELIGDCKIPFKDYDWIEGDYFKELNSFLYYGRPEGKNQPGYIFKFGF